MTDYQTDRLSDYLDGELDREPHEEVARHLESCEQCRATLDDLRHIRDWAASFQGDAGDEREWYQMEHRRRRANFSVGLRAAAVVLGVVGLAMIVWYGSGHDGAGGVAREAETTLSASPVVFSEDAVYTAEIQALEDLLRDRGQSLDPRTRKALEESLESIEQTLAKVREELARNPEDGLLQELEIRSRQQKLRLLSRTLRLSTQGVAPRV